VGIKERAALVVKLVLEVLGELAEAEGKGKLQTVVQQERVEMAAQQEVTPFPLLTQKMVMHLYIQALLLVVVPVEPVATPPVPGVSQVLKVTLVLVHLLLHKAEQEVRVSLARLVVVAF